MGLEDSNPLGRRARDLRRELEGCLGLRFERAIRHGALEPAGPEGCPPLEEARRGALQALESGAWRVRNEGVKLLGLSLHPDGRELLCGLLADRTPAPPLHRLLGGDYFHCGFERRNAIFSLALLGEWDGEITGLVTDGLADPYYEVRTACCRWTATALDGRCRIEGGPESLRREDGLVTGVCALFEDPRLEVRCAAWRAAGLLADPGRVLSASAGYLADSRVRIREALLDCFGGLLDRFGDRTAVLDGVAAQMDGMLLTSVAMRPNYPIRQRYREVMQRLKGEPCST